MKISVALCTYNGEKFLEQQLSSIFSQTCCVHEVVVYDDNSTDNTYSILRKYERENAELFKCFQNVQQVGAIKNFEQAVSACSGDIIFLSDQDDIWLPNKVEQLTQAFAEDGGALMFFTNGVLIDHQGNNLGSSLWDKWRFTEEIQNKWRNNNKALESLVVNRNYITGATAVFKKELKKNLFPFTVPNGYWHDTWIGTHAAALGGLRFVNESTIQYRVHSAQQIGIGSGTQVKTGDVLSLNTITEMDYRRRLQEIYPKKKSIIFSVLPFHKRVYRKGISFIRKIKNGVSL